MFELMSREFWLVAFVIAAIGYSLAQKRLRSEAVERRPPIMMQAAVMKAVAGSWLVMGMGRVSGRAPTVWHYLRPQDANPFVLLYFATVFLLSLGGCVWLLRNPRALDMLQCQCDEAGWTGRRLNQTDVSVVALAVPLTVALAIVILVLADAEIPPM